MAYKVCSSCKKHVRENETTCWNCRSSQFEPVVKAPVPPPSAGFIDKVKGHVGTLKAVHQKYKENAAEEKRRQEEAEAKRQEELAAARKSAFERARKTCPLPLVIERTKVAGGLDLFNDEFVVTVGNEWGWSTQQLTLTTHCVLWSKGFLSTAQTSIYLTDIRDVRYRKPILRHGAIVLETAGGHSIEGLPAASNGDAVRDRLMAMIHWARHSGAHEHAPAAAPAVAAPQVPDRLDQLRRLGELKAQGILSEEEFQAEKAKLLAQSS